MIIKCKMCGGDLHPAENATTCECEYCGSVQTIPKLDNERRANLYDRANHFRRSNDYDKAMGIFEQILQDDRTDAEAYWSLVLCRYGIEYVEDPATHKRVPTVNRVQFTSILADEDYKSALEYADAVQRGIYEQEAKTIDALQKGILEISKKEKPFDVFICYKETDAEGRRTPDSVLANDLYHQLTREGFKVFFSRITLEDKLGQQYEPYIFAALNSAKVMVVLGTKPEYFSAVWVKNEWSRYLALMAHDRKRLLIPCYRDMDPYDLPEELSALQSQDMSKIGFMQDLLRGVQKVMNADNQAEASGAVRKVVQTVAGGMTPGINSLMERTYLFMEDSDFDSAEEYINRVLDIDPKYAPAYAAKVCVAFRIRKESGLADVPFLYEDNSDWQKALRFADSKQRAIYAGYIEKVKPRVAAQIRDYAFDCAVEMAVNPKANREQLERELANYKTSCQCSNGCRANGSRRRDSQQNSSIFQKAVSRGEPGDVSEQQLKTAAGMFAAIGDSEGSACAQNCRALAEQARQKAIYENASRRRAKIGMPDLTDAADLEACAKQFGQIPGYKDAKQRAEQCLQDAENARETVYNDAVEAMQEAEKGNFSFKWKKAIGMLGREGLNGYRDVEELRKQAEQRRKECENAEEKERQAKERRKKTLTIAAVVVVMIACAIAWCIPNVIIPNNKYQQAVALREAGQYDDAIAAFAELGDYSDANEQIAETWYQKALISRENGMYEYAYTIFSSLGDYSDAAQQLSETKYQQAVSLREAGEYESAIAVFASLNNYRDAETQIEEMKQEKYQQAVALRENGQYEDAIAAFAELENYSDAATQITETKYQLAMSLREIGKYDEAIAMFGELGDYRNVTAQIMKTKYQKAVVLRENGQYDDAIAVFTELHDYSDAKVQISETKYQQAVSLREAGNYESAIPIFESINDYCDAETQIEEMKQEKYQQAVTLRVNGQYEEAIAAFKALGKYSDAKAQITETQYQRAVALRENGQYEEAIAAFMVLGKYSDAKAQITETKYQQATNLKDSGKYDEAYAIYVTLTGYKDVDKMLAEDANMIAAAVAAREVKFSVGNYVTFGEYPQTAFGRDMTSIEWLVLARDGNRALLISRYGLDAQPYNTKKTAVTWANCTLRTWLNGTFYKKAFSNAEQAAILTTNVDNSKNQCYSRYSTSGGNNTQDKVFLLSYAEAKKYLGATDGYIGGVKACVAPTAYAAVQGAERYLAKTADGINAGNWWLRSPGASRDEAMYVNAGGHLLPRSVDDDSVSVRPALWVNLESGIF